MGRKTKKSGSIVVAGEMDAAAVDAVVDLIVRGRSERDLIAEIRSRWPKAESRPLIIEALKRLASSAGGEPMVVIGWAIEATRKVYQHALIDGEYGAALRAIKQLVDLSLEPPINVPPEN